MGSGKERRFRKKWKRLFQKRQKFTVKTIMGRYNSIILGFNSFVLAVLPLFLHGRLIEQIRPDIESKFFILVFHFGGFKHTRNLGSLFFFLCSLCGPFGFFVFQKEVRIIIIRCSTASLSTCDQEVT